MERTVGFVGLGAMGNIRTETMRAHTAEEMDKILARLK